MSIEDELSNIESLIAKSVLGKAIDSLVVLVKHSLPDYTNSILYEELLVCSSNYYRLRSLDMSSTIHFEQISVEKAKISRALINLLFRVKQEVLNISEVLSIEESNNFIKAIIIDDEPIARDVLEIYIEKIDHIQLIGKVSNAIEGLKLIYEERPDLVFLDIQMPQLTGIDFLAAINEQITFHVIFTTAYANYAIEAMELNAVDYLLKPISLDRFIKSVNRVRSRIEKENHTEKYKILVENIRKNRRSISIKLGSKEIFVEIGEILFAKSNNAVVDFYLKKNHIASSDQPLSYYSKLLNKSSFFQIGDEYLLSVTNLKSLETIDQEYCKLNYGIKYELTIAKALLHDLIDSFERNKIEILKPELPKVVPDSFPLNIYKEMMRMNPHFLKNIFHSINGLILKQDYDMANKFANEAILFYESFVKNTQIFHSIKDEINLVEKYINLENFKYNNKISLEVSTSNLEVNDILIPKLAIQTFVNNAIKHGFLDQQLHILIEIEYKPFKPTSIVIRNNGKGIQNILNSKIIEINNQKTSGGLAILSNLFNYLNEMYQMETSFNIAPIKNEDNQVQGTEVRLFVPDKYLLK